MRVLFATTANDGHFGPLLPFALACADAGHEVRVAAPASFAAAVDRAGLVHEPFADAPGELVGPVMARLPHLSFAEADDTVVREVFGRIDAQAAYPGVRDTVERWRPDVLVRESAELGSVAAAAGPGVPQVHVCIGMHEVAARFAERVQEPLVELAGLAGLPTDTVLEAFSGATVLSLVPELIDGVSNEFLRFSEPVVVPSGPRPADWGRRDRPLVYVTFGSVAGTLPPFAGCYREAMDALADLDATVLVTVGRRVDPDSLSPIPPNARVRQWVPQERVLAHAAAVLGHGGFGTTMGALAAGVPQAVAPLFTFDQVVNGEHVAAVGAGVTTRPGPGGVAEAAARIGELLSGPGYLSAAGRVARAVADLPPPADAVRILRQLAR